MKAILIATVMLAATVPAVAGAQTTAESSSSSSSQAAPYYSTASTVGDLLDNPATKAVLAKYLPQVVASDQINQARALPLAALQQYRPDIFTNDVLAKINADLANVPAPKSQ